MSAGHPQGAPLPDEVLLPQLFDQADVGILIAVVVALAGVAAAALRVGATSCA